MARKSVIDVLKDGRVLKTKELVAEAKVPIRTLWRILKELKTYGLVEKRDDKYWVWSEYENRWEGSPIEYKALTGHAIDLIPGFRELINAFPDFWFPWYSSYTQFNKTNKEKEMQDTLFSFQKLPPYEKLSILSECAESHLKAYPKIYENLRICKSLNEKYEKADINTKQLLNTVGSAVIMIKEITPEIEQNFNVTKKGLIEEGIPYILGIWTNLPEIFRLKKSPRFKLSKSSLINDHKGYVSLVDPYGENHIMGVKGPIKGNFDTEMFEEIIKMIPFVREPSGELVKQIYQLVSQVHLQPLKGHCKQCPNIKIESESSSKRKLFKNKS